MNHLKKTFALTILAFLLVSCFGNNPDPEWIPAEWGITDEESSDSDQAVDNFDVIFEEDTPADNKEDEGKDPIVDNPDVQVDVPAENTPANADSESTVTDKKDTPSTKAKSTQKKTAEKKPAAKKDKKSESDEKKEDKKDDGDNSSSEKKSAKSDEKKWEKSEPESSSDSAQSDEEELLKEFIQDVSKIIEEQWDEENTADEQKTSKEETTELSANVARDLEDFSQEKIPVAKITEVQREEIQEAIDAILPDAMMAEIDAKKGLEWDAQEKKIQEIHQEATQKVTDQFPHIDFWDDFDIFTVQL